MVHAKDVQEGQLVRWGQEVRHVRRIEPQMDGRLRFRFDSIGAHAVYLEPKAPVEVIHCRCKESDKFYGYVTKGCEAHPGVDPKWVR